MILVFLGNMRATLAVFLSIPLSALATFIGLTFGDSSINSMILGGLALAFSRLIDNSVVVLENIFRHLELGETPEVAAEKGGREVALPGARRDAHHRGRFLPRHVSLRSQPLPFLGARALGRALALRLVRRRDDGRAALLREADQRPRPQRRLGRIADADGPFQRLVQRALQPLSRPLRSLANAGARPAARDRAQPSPASSSSASACCRKSAWRTSRGPIRASS